MDSSTLLWVIFLVLFFGGGEAVVRVFQSLTDKRVASLKTENKQLRAQIGVWEKSANVREISSAPSLAVTASPAAADYSAEMEALILRVQQTDTVYPQLPSDLREDIDELVQERRDSRRASVTKSDEDKTRKTRKTKTN